MRKTDWTTRLVTRGLFSVLLTSLVVPGAASALVTDSDRVRLAKREGRVVVYSVLSTKAAQPLIDDFQSLYPGIKVEYDGEKGSNDMDERYRSELASGRESADVVWSSATDMQMQLVSEGYAARYRSQEARALPRWAIYKEMAYGVTLEPVAIVYNREVLTGADIPRDHDALIEMLGNQKDRFSGKITGFDIGSSGVGFMFAAQDRKHYARFDKLWLQMGASHFKPLAGTGDMLTQINSGKFLLGYNMMGSYALSRSGKDLPNLGVIFPADFTLAFPRVAFISKRAANPNAAKLWLDYMLSRRGQELLADGVQLFPVRSDVRTSRSAKKLSLERGTSLQTIPVSMKLLEDIAPHRKSELLEQWSRALKAAPAPSARKEP